MEVPKRMDQLPQLLRRESAITTPALGTFPSTSAVINVPPLQWEALGVSEGKGREGEGREGKGREGKGNEGRKFIDQLARSVAEEKDGGQSLRKASICKERIF